ncbi:tetratricopeptide repeat protein 1 [Fundulus heteroclitus]|uniref:tetratricopeptide repeat protein 1 n=1 Tax=Fundulus heteroclitus TaxID=8078 RepID=UPI00165B1FB1|nr:tetratricopeptide repeat protein 1 [Fundulus heteroclitus]XP_021166817.2 tetratricopeptide repeat protein 1 [Fundulus heteroclitus]
MSSRGGEQEGRGAAPQAGAAEREDDEEDFYDCQEIMEAPHSPEEQQEDSHKDASGSEEVPPKNPDSIPDHGDTDRETGGGRQEEEPGEEKLEEEEEEEEHQDQDSDSELKDEEMPKGVEFDDDYLREVEKELTEEEKESRRQQSVALKETGNSLFKAGDWKEAEESYTEALAVCPVAFSRERAVLFSNRAAARLHLELNDEAISDCSRAIGLDPDYLRALLRRAELYEKTQKLDEALEDYKQVLERDPSNSGARRACMRLPQQIQERNEKLKEEMMDKLKDLGNLILRPFGLSTSNFQVNQDPSSGSYSINFVQNPNNNHTG